MPGIVISLSQAVYQSLIDHLLPKGSDDEEAAFLFVRGDCNSAQPVLTVIDWFGVDRAGFATQSSGYLELVDEMRPTLIKRAHDLAACIVEMHSHPHPWPAAFSPTDLRGLNEFVPHVRWRLKGKPYVAVVVAPTGFDALAWTNESGKSEEILGISIDGTLLRPTAITFANLNAGDDT